MKNQLLTIIRQAAEETRPELAKTMDEQGGETVLFGPGGQLDSLGLVTLIAAVEREIEDQMDAYVILADEDAMSRSKSPFRTVGALAEYAEERLRDEA